MGNGKWRLWVQVLFVLVAALFCVGLMTVALVVMVTEAREGWLQEWIVMFHANPGLWVGILCVVGVNTLLPLVGGVVYIVHFEKMRKQGLTGTE